MRGDALAAMEDFDGARRDAHPHLLAQQLVRRGVVVLLDLDVIVEPEPALLPLGVDVGLCRQCFERRLLQLLEQRLAARAQVPRDAGIEGCDLDGDGRIQLGEREELPLPEPGDDPARGHLHADLDPGLRRGRLLALSRGL